MPRRPLHLALLGALLLALLTPRALADDVILRITGVSTSATQVSITGTLHEGEAAVRRQEIVAIIDGNEIGRNTTRGNGAFTISAALAAPLAEGRHTVLVRFNGGGGHSPAASSTELSVSATGIGSDSGAPTKAPQAPDPALTLSASAPDAAINGEVIELSGRVVDASGSGVEGAGISVRDASGDVSDSYTLSDEHGRFVTWYSIPADQAEGDMRLTLSARGAGTDKVTVVVPITRTELPDEDAETPTPTPTPTTTTDTDDTEDTARPAPSNPTTASATPAPVEEDTDGTPFVWLMAAVGAVASIAVVCFGLVVARARHGRGYRGSSELTFFDDEDEAFPVRHDTDHTQAPGPPAPRRGLPSD